MDDILVVDSLRKEYAGFTLDGISFKLERGYVMGFIGPNGAGKTTTIKLIMNLIKRDAGQISIFGRDNIEDERLVKEKIGFVYGNNVFYGVLSINEMKSLIAPLYRDWDDAGFYKYLRDFGLDPNKKIDHLSRGMKIKFALAVALSHNAELILMDEPTSGLDPVFRSELLEILYSIIRGGEKSIFFSTHVTTDLEKIADYITFIDDGRLVFSETKDSVLDKYRLVKGPKGLLDEDTRREFIGVREHSLGFEALTDKAENVRRVFGDKVLLERASLEDIMLFTVRRGKCA